MKLLPWVLVMTSLQSLSGFAGQSIERPILYSGAEKVRSCLEGILLTHTEDPGQTFGQWKGPGVRASGAGEVDPSTALFLFQMLPSKKWYAIAFYSQDDEGWKLFSYQRNEGIRIGYRARSMESIGYLFRAEPRESTLDDTIPYEEIDLSPCAEYFSS